jgi:group I intron endonuclease
MNLRHGSVYVVTNKHTGEQYVGQTRQSVQKRWDAHWRTATCSKSRKAKFQVALLTAGKEAFIVDELFVAFDADALNKAEILLISELQPAYNVSRGGKGLRPFIVSEETKAKRSKDAKARWASPEWKAKTVASIQRASQTPEAILRGKALRAYKGVEARWAGHVKKERLVSDKSAKIKTSWQNPIVRQKRIDGLKFAFGKPEVHAKLVASLTGRVMSRQAIEKTAQAKWKPLYCPEIQTTFLCGKYAAEYFGTLRTSVANAVKQKGKLLHKYSLEMVV